jgi:hypothetical protein
MIDLAETRPDLLDIDTIVDRGRRQVKQRSRRDSVWICTWIGSEKHGISYGLLPHPAKKAEFCLSPLQIGCADEYLSWLMVTVSN